jgi:S-adenosylmethionine:tRNA ribosyltransferase-isomerase
MQLSDFHYDIPDELIADQPAKTRGTSRLLVLNRSTGQVEDRSYKDCVDYLNPGDVLIINDTKVIKARLLATKENGAVRELILVEKHGRSDDWHTHKVIYRRSLHAGDTLTIGNDKIEVAEILDGGMAIIKSQRDLLSIADEHGTVPLPPYMKRQATDDDVQRYQTVFAREEGSVAAPTASLNMTEEILASLTAKGIIVKHATLHVGLGTFLPIRVDDVTKHHMHKEYFEIPSDTVQAIQTAKSSGNRVIALGTTITRTLEYAHEEILNGAPHDISGEADIFIYPGYEFKTIDVLMTNFHMPESTVLMLTAAFGAWDNLKPAYEHAVAQRYQFFSYGDSMLIY